MSMFLRSVKKFIENGNIFIEDGVPVLFFEVVSDDARRATFSDICLIKPVWASLVNRLIGGRK